MKSVTYWYQFFTAREELLVPILHDVKFTKCEIYGSTMLSDLEELPNKTNWASLVRSLLMNLGFYEV